MKQTKELKKLKFYQMQLHTFNNKIAVLKLLIDK